VQAGLAEALVNLGRTEQAVAALERNLADDLRALPSYVLLGQAYLHRGEYEKAKENFEHVIQRAPTYSHAYYGLVRACSRLGEQQKCAEYLEKFKTLKKAEADTRKAKLGILRNEDEAIQELASVHRLAAGVYEQQGELLEAENHLRRAATVNPADTLSREALVRLYRQQNRLPDALVQIEQLRRIEPNSFDYARGAATLYARLGRFDAAEETFQQVLRQWPEESWGYLGLCQLYLQGSRKIPEAVKLAEKAAQLDPAASTYFLLSAARERNGDLTGALSAIERARELDPGNPQYLRAERMIREKL
jgi:tetratricopeptide (TPR) repeat protein